MTEAEPLTLAVDVEHGGRWTSLRSSDREWLWTNRDPTVRLARPGVRPGDPFVDAGGVEECFPTVRGRPDHGDAWTRAWTGVPADATVAVDGHGTLRRRVRTGREVTVDYEVTGVPGTPFLHAVHALLDLSPKARLEVPGATTMTVLDVDDPVRPWPSGLDHLGPDDGTAVCALLPGCREVTVVDGPDRLRLRWESPDDPAACSLLVWRNLGGWPEDHPYRSIGVEPMVGRAADLATARPEDCARLTPTGTFRWRLTLDSP